MGCVVFVGPEETVETIDITEEVLYVDSYLSIPSSVLTVIAPYVQDYFSPELSRYCNYLYPKNTPYDPYNLPCYVVADYNGDGYDDYAFLFSMEEWDTDNWYVTTKLIVVLSCFNGYELICDLELGTAYADVCEAVEEFWSICYLPAGYHTVTITTNKVQISETYYLENDGFFLASLDPDEESYFYVENDELYEGDWLNRRSGKQKVSENRKNKNNNPKNLKSYSKNRTFSVK